MKKIRLFLLIAMYVMVYSLTAGQTVVPDTVAVAKTAKGVQCKGITKASQQCKKITRDPSGYCFMHKNEGKGAKK